MLGFGNDRQGQAVDDHYPPACHNIEEYTVQLYTNYARISTGDTQTLDAMI